MIRQGEVIGGTYQVLNQIGSGGSGLVFLAYHMNLRKYVVIKRVRSMSGNINVMRAESDILKTLRHTNIPQVYDFLVRDGEVFTVMDYIDGISFDKLPAGKGRISERNLVNMFAQLAEVLSYIHSHRPPVVHSDIKPANLILSKEGNTCLIDFNISVSASVADSLSGFSMHYASPEQYQRAEQIRARSKHVTQIDARSDIYSAGAVFYYLITGCCPDTRKPPQSSALSYVQTGGRPFDARILCRDMMAVGYSEALCRAISKCLEPSRGMRYENGTKLRNAIRHLRRQDSRFRNYILLRAGSWILSAAILGGGIWLIVRGVHQQTLDSYISDYTKFTSAQVEGDTAAASMYGLELLNKSEYSSIRDDRPQDEAMILQCIGDDAYEKKQYSDAQQYYGEALEAAKKAGLSTSRYYRDYAIALMMDDQLRKAQICLDDAKNASGINDDQGLLNDPDLALMQAHIYLQEKDPEKCIETVNVIMASPAEGDIKARACILAADASKEREISAEERESARFIWLERAVECSPEAKYQRILGSEYMKKTEESSHSEYENQNWAKKALVCYENLCRRSHPLLDDVIGRVIIIQYLGEYEKSKSILEAYKYANPDDYRIPMYMAIACDKLEDRSGASKYARKALELYEAAPRANSSDNEAIDLIRQLQ